VLFYLFSLSAQGNQDDELAELKKMLLGYDYVDWSSKMLETIRRSN
jgi:hypothetical protein